MTINFDNPLGRGYEKGRESEVEYELEIEHEGVGADDAEYVMEEVADPEDDPEDFGGR